MPKSTDLKEKILDMALDIADESGLEQLTQPRLAKALGIRQSHLTYYFPRKADLFVALLGASHRRAAAGETMDILARLHSIMFNRKRMRFFLGILLEVSEDPELRSVMAEHSYHLHKEVASYFKRPADDPEVAAFIALLRGQGLALLLKPEKELGSVPDIQKIALDCGLKI